MTKNNLKIQIIDQQGQEISQQELSPKIFDVEINSGLIHQAVVTQLANRRQNLSHTKQRAEVRGGGRKPWRQKGTGRARHGSSRSPLWIGGGVTFGPTTERNFKKKINQKMKKKAIWMCLSDKVANNLMLVLDKIELKKIKTQDMVRILNKVLPTEEKDKKIKKVDPKTKETKITNKKIKVQPSCLMVLDDKNDELVKSARNIDKIKIIRVENLNILDILQYKYFLTTVAGIQKITQLYISEANAPEIKSTVKKVSKVKEAKVSATKK
ncbi:MAG: 50S ribosomal protein L4 [Patescibacteria group bacterium]|jgi:large subunit ribosomal protein L4|nr:50S ribosomal protein L4 [Patescibacteria group bacterium]